MCFAGATLLASPAGRAQESAQVLASRALFDEGRRLMAEGRYAEACRKLEESQNLRSGVGTLFNLAECQEKVGRTASAWSLYLRVAAETRALGQSDREEVARARADALEPRLSRLVLEVPSKVSGLEIELDGVPMAEATWGVATPLDPGEHRLVARAPGHETWRGSPRIAADGSELTVTIPELKPAAPVASASPPDAELKPALQAPPEHDDGQTQPSPLRANLPYVLAAVGGAGVIGGGLLGLRALDRNGDAEEICVEEPRACPRSQIERHEELTSAARKARTAGYITAGAGIAAIGVAAALWLSDAEPETADLSALRLVPELGASTLGVAARGSF